jgi:hypothetical protein
MSPPVMQQSVKNFRRLAKAELKRGLEEAVSVRKSDPRKRLRISYSRYD